MNMSFIKIVVVSVVLFLLSTKVSIAGENIAPRIACSVFKNDVIRLIDTNPTRRASFFNELGEKFVESFEDTIFIDNIKRIGSNQVCIWYEFDDEDNSNEETLIATEGFFFS